MTIDEPESRAAFTERQVRTIVALAKNKGTEAAAEHLASLLLAQRERDAGIVERLNVEHGPDLGAAFFAAAIRKQA